MQIPRIAPPTPPVALSRSAAPAPTAPSIAGPAAPAAHDIAGDQAALETHVARAREFFTRLGVTEAEGNGPVPLILRQDIDDASYQAILSFAPNGAAIHTDEKIEIGNSPYTGTSFARAADVIAHEFSHRINEHLVPGIGSRTGSFGRIVDESIADTFAAAITGDWTIGESAAPEGIRSLANPGQQRRIVDGKTVWYPTAATFDQITTARIAEGPYSNIGPLNNAAYRIGMKLGTDTMARIYLQTLREHLAAEAGPTELVMGTIRAAAQLYGDGSDELTAVRDAWKGVGLRAAAVDSIK